MHIAYTMAPGPGDMDQLLLRLAEALVADGHRPYGTVQINTETDTGEPCDMDVKVLPDGPVIRISQSLGPGATGCRLDPDAMAQAVRVVEAGLSVDADCLIINKFGKQEASGQGFRQAIAEALALDLPVIVGLNAANTKAFEAFTDGAGEAIPADLGALQSWIKPHLRRRD